MPDLDRTITGSGLAANVDEMAQIAPAAVAASAVVDSAASVANWN
jgi:hypothetical protein